MAGVLSAGELRYCEAIKEKDRALRGILAENSLQDAVDPRQLFAYLVGVRSALGNLSNDVSFAATLLAKQYLERRFGQIAFDAALKAQGAPGIDVEAATSDGETIAGEIKTTVPYQPGFGAQQRTTILKDMTRLATSQANHRLMFVTDQDTFSTLCKPAWASRAPGVEIVDLLAGTTFVCPK